MLKYAIVREISETKTVGIEFEDGGGSVANVPTIQGYEPILGERVAVAQTLPAGQLVIGSVYNLPT